MSKHSTPLDQPCPPTQFSLPLPAGLEDQLGADQQRKLAKIQIHFARSVASLMIKAYAEVAQLLDECDGKPAAEL
jgi:hypothetical protein